MRIGVDARPLRVEQTSGIPMYVRSILGELAARDRENEYLLYSNRDFRFEVPAHWRKRVGAVTQKGTLWMQAELPFQLARDGVKVFWGTEQVVPLVPPPGVRTVVTVCDVVHVLHPDTMDPLNRVITRVFLPPSVRRADAIAAISAATLADVQRYFKPRTRRLHVIHLGVSDRFAPPRDPEAARARVEAAHPGLGRYVLTVGTFEPRKNIHGLIRAFLSIAPRIPHTLAIAGQKGWGNEAAHEEIRRSGMAERIRLLGYLPDEAMPDLYAGAELFAFPSFYEGFGLPPLEAMASGVPVVCSAVASLPEVVGDAAETVDPHRPEDIARGLLAVLEDPARRREMIARGLERAAHFRWDRVADAYRALFAEVAGERRRAGVAG